jgi:hypothetical protein
METQTETAKPAQGRCPRCGSTQVHRSRRRGFDERFLVLLGGHLRRCGGCGYRFIRIRGITWNAPDSRRLGRTLMWGLLAALGAALIIVMMVWMTQRQAAGPAADPNSRLRGAPFGYSPPVV